MRGFSPPLTRGGAEQEYRRRYRQTSPRQGDSNRLYCYFASGDTNVGSGPGSGGVATPGHHGEGPSSSQKINRCQRDWSRTKRCIGHYRAGNPYGNVHSVRRQDDVASFNTLYVWKGTSGGDWFDNHNWMPGFPEGASPPGYGDLVIFNNGGADAVAGNGTASELDVVLGTTLTIQDSVSTDGAVSGVGLMIDSGGTAIVGSGATKPGIPSSPGGVSVDVIGFT